jgi:N-acetyl-anhydromuramyl-L-alanine amidase AmpD
VVGEISSYKLQENKMKKIYFIIVLISIASNLLAVQPDSLQIIDLTTTVNYGHRKTPTRKIDIVVIHSSYYVAENDSFSLVGVMKQYQQYGVSPHYIIDREGVIYRTVADNNVAFHAGQSQLPGTNRTNLNTNSIGIEIINTFTTPPTDAQYESLARLVNKLKMTYPIQYVVRHSDISPGRKTDPWAFDWEMFLEKIK